MDGIDDGVDDSLVDQEILAEPFPGAVVQGVVLVQTMDFSRL
jgi:hypothetical protein